MKETRVPERVFDAVLSHLGCSLPDQNVHRTMHQQWIILSNPKLYIYPNISDGFWELWDSGKRNGTVTSTLKTSCEDVDLIMEWVYRTLTTLGIDCSSVNRVFKPRVVYPEGEQQELCL